jgi:hypothetical protein
MTKSRKPIKSDVPYDPRPRKKLSKDDTPQEVIDKLNAEFQEWKVTPQVQYDTNGKRMGEK